MLKSILVISIAALWTTSVFSSNESSSSKFLEEEDNYGLNRLCPHNSSGAIRRKHCPICLFNYSLNLNHGSVLPLYWPNSSSSTDSGEPIPVLVAMDINSLTTHYFAVTSTQWTSSSVVPTVATNSLDHLDPTSVFGPGPSTSV